MLHWKKDSLAHRLVVRVILFSTLVTVVFTALQLYLDYRQDLRSIQIFFNAIKDTSLRPLEESVWILDELQVNLQLEGLIKRQDIVYAAVEMDRQITWAKGMPLTRNSITQSFPLVHHSRGGIEQIGTLHVMASLEGIYQRLLRRVVILLISNGIKTFLVAGFILLLLRNSLTKPLERLAAYVQTIDIQHQQPAPFLFDRSPAFDGDELGQVGDALNDLCRGGSQAYRALRMQEQKLRLFFDATEEAIFGVDVEGRCTFINRTGCAHFGVDREETLIGQDLFALLARDVQGRPQPSPLIEQVRRTIAETAMLFGDEVDLVDRNGAPLLITLRSYPVVEEQQCIGAIVFFVDTSQQHRLEQEKQLFTRIVRQAPALILITSAEGVIEYVNASFEQIMAADATSLVGTRALERFRPLNIEQQIEPVRARIRQGGTWIGTLATANMQGRPVTLDATIFPIFDRQGQLTNVVAMGRDITREQQLLDQLHHAQKMEAMGKLAASVAHEFGNPLLGIRFALRDILQRAGVSAEDANLLQLAEKECDRMRKLIRDLQQFNRPSTGRKTEFDPHRILEEIVRLHQNLLIKKHITVVRDYDPHPVRLLAVEDQIRQVFINLIINASDAMAAGGGTLTLRTSLVDEQIVVSVEDSGSGIAAENLDRIFEPFFTTKSAVEGTGLGLPVSYGIVRAHGGTITVESVPGKTVFAVTLPLETATEGEAMLAEPQPRG